MGNSRHVQSPTYMSFHRLPKDWRRHPGCPCHTWLRTLEADLQPLNHGLNSAWRHVQDGGRWKWLCCSQGHAHDDGDNAIASEALAGIFSLESADKMKIKT